MRARDCLRLQLARGRVRHVAVAVAPHVLHPVAETREPLQRLTRHRTQRDVSADHDVVAPDRVHLGEHGLERREIAVDVGHHAEEHAPESLARWSQRLKR